MLVESEVSTSSPSGEAEPKPFGPRSTSRPGIFVLFVDDMPDIRRLYDRYFQFRGLRVATAANGPSALEALAAERPDVLVVDLAMPEMTGWELIRRMRTDAETRRIPIVALSGLGAAESALAAGADIYIDKPCGPEELLRAVLSLLRRSAMPDE